MHGILSAHNKEISTTTYKVFDVKRSALEGEPNARIEVASGSALKSVVRMAKIWVDREWATVPKIFIQINGNRPYSVTAACLNAYRRKVLVTNFSRQIEIVRFEE